MNLITQTLDSSDTHVLFNQVESLESVQPEYRIANENDIDDIMSLWNESRLYHAELDPRLSMVDDAHLKAREYYVSQLTSADTVFYIATSSDTPIGYLCAQIQKAPPVHKIQRFGFIDGLFVRETFRRMGVGTSLVTLAMDWFEEQQISMVQLSVASMNEIGIRFWERCGFTEVMRRMRMKIAD